MTTEYNSIFCEAVRPSAVILNCSPLKKKLKKTNYWLYCRADWWQMTPIPFTFLPPSLMSFGLYQFSLQEFLFLQWWRLSCKVSHARLILSSWTDEMTSVPQSTSFFCSHQWIFFLSPPIHGFVAVFYKWLALWYSLQDAAASQLHLSFAFKIYKAGYTSNLTV